MEIRPLAMGWPGIRADRTIEFLRTRQGIENCQLAYWATALGRPVANAAVCRTERTQRQALGINDLVVIAGVLRVSPLSLPPEPTTL
ncbi:XRE family transcriptional regulator [Streptomyces niveus]|uniref:XRE family transcriptional regulator n=1 Tax=Streptomyces niveus TaxID=193462 RepID=UPI0036DA0620